MSTTTTTTFTESDVTIKMHHEIDDAGEYRAFTRVDVEILVCGNKAGTIEGTIVNRKNIPSHRFLSAMDGHSGQLQEIGVSLFEPRLGRTILKSLKDGGDDNQFDFLYISVMHIEDLYKTSSSSSSSDVGAFALRRLLHHPYIKGKAKDGCWKVSSCIYILDPLEVISNEEQNRINAEEGQERRLLYSEFRPSETEDSLRIKKERKQRMDDCARLDANQFLRNGFFQDEAHMQNGGDDRFLVSSYSHWNKPMKSHEDAAAIQFYITPPQQREPVGKDAMILDITKRKAPNTSIDNIREYQKEVSQLVSEGGSLVRSNALHAAVANQNIDMTKCILGMDPLTLNAKDQTDATPLMIAAARAAGQSTRSGLPTDQPIIDLLLTAGAQREAVNFQGMTAYGCLKDQMKSYDQMMAAMCGNATSNLGPKSHNVPGLLQLEAKLIPAGGPTAADLSGSSGAGTHAGIIDYKAEDGNDFDDDSDDDY